MNPDSPMFQLINQLLVVDPTNLAFTSLKIMVIIGALLYVIFAFVVIRQIQLMNRTIRTLFSHKIKLIAFLHLILSIFVVVLAIVAL